MPLRTQFSRLGQYHFCYKTAKIKFIKKTLKKLGCQIRTDVIQQSKCWALPLGDSPIFFFGNALFRPVSSQICRLKRYPMLSRTLPNRHGVSRTPIFGFGDRHATINTTRLHIFNYLFQYLNQHLQLVLIIHNRPSIVFRSCKLPFPVLSYLFHREPGRLPLAKLRQSHLIHFLILSFFLLYIFFQLFNQLTYL